MTAPGDLEALQLPAGSRLVHIGPSKTGTTSVQGAMWSARAEMRRQGVRYLGQSRHSGLGARAVAGMPSPYSNTGNSPSMRYWEAIVRELAQAREPRAIFSSEYLAHAPRERVQRVVRDLGGSRVHVAVTLRPLPKMLASRWQQGVQAGNRMGLDAWLEHVLGRQGDLPDARLWQAHRHDRLIDLWAEIVGADRVTAIVVDENDHAWILRVFEALLGLRTGTLTLQQDAENRSLTYPEVEAVRALNIELERQGVPPRVNRLLVHDGFARRVKHRTPRPDEQRVVPPAWAVVRAREVAEHAVAGIRASGVRVIGDLDGLVAVPGGAASEPPDPASMPTDVAMAMAVGLLQGGGLLVNDQARAPGKLEPPKEIPTVSDRRLLRIYARRKRTALGRAMRAQRGAAAPED